MSYLDGPFDYDVFVSYAHGGGRRLKEWSQRLVDELESEIQDFSVDFDELEVFIDTELDPTKPLTGQLRGSVRASGLLLVIMTDRYLSSSWCKDEMDWFAAEIQECQSGGGQVLVVRATPTDHEQWPQCLKDERNEAMLGFRFHPEPKTKAEEDAIRPLGFPAPRDDDREYFCELGKLATITTRRLRELKERRTSLANAEVLQTGPENVGKPQIYLDAPSGHQPEWQIAKSDLEAVGYTVLPEAWTEVGRDLKSIEVAREQRLTSIREEANALLLLRPPNADEDTRYLEMILNDRFTLRSMGRDIPCLILNQSQNVPGQADELGIGLIDARGENWQVNFSTWYEGESGDRTAQ